MRRGTTIATTVVELLLDVFLSFLEEGSTVNSVDAINDGDVVDRRDSYSKINWLSLTDNELN